MKIPTFVSYKGFKYQLQSNGRYYYNESKNNPFENLFHRALWVERFGKIPTGKCVHHKDGNCHNNRTSNFVLMGRSEHAKHHIQQRMRNTPKAFKKFWQAGVSLAPAWHKSESGREWHSENAKNNWLNRVKDKPHVCKHCKTKFLAYMSHASYCCNDCEKKDYFIKNKNSERVCRVCGGVFLTNRFSKATHCSKGCTAIGIARIKLTKKHCGGTLAIKSGLLHR